MELKRCPKCEEIKELNCYSKNNNNKKTGLSSWCKKCNSEHKKVHYQKNREKYIEHFYEYISWFLNIKKDLKCERCGFDKHPAALDFHHKDPTQKEFSLGMSSILKRKNKDKVLKELEKCEVLCSNCHRIEHAKNYNKYILNK